MSFYSFSYILGCWRIHSGEIEVEKYMRADCVLGTIGRLVYIISLNLHCNPGRNILLSHFTNEVTEALRGSHLLKLNT